MKILYFRLSMSRHQFLPVSALLLLCLPLSAWADEGVLAAVAPDSGPLFALGAQVFAGAQRLANEKKLKLVRIGESCEAESGSAIAKQVVAAKAGAAIGFLCTESLETGGNLLEAAHIPAISVSVRSKILFEDAKKNGWPVFSLAPQPGDEADKIASVILDGWQTDAFALLDDGTLPSRELVDAIRARLEEKGLKPQFTDTIRPGLDNQIATVRRLQKTGVVRAFVAAARNDVAVIARDAASESVSLQLLGGEAMMAANEPVPLPNGVQAVALPETAASGALLEAFRKDGVIPEGYVLPAYAAATIAVQAMEASGKTGKPVTDSLSQTSFETVLGPFAFGKDAPHRNPYQLMTWQNGAFVGAVAQRQ